MEELDERYSYHAKRLNQVIGVLIDIDIYMHISVDIYIQRYENTMYYTKQLVQHVIVQNAM